MTPGLLESLGVRDYPGFVLVSARVAGLFSAAPLWSMAGMPRAARGAVVVVLSLVLLPSLPGTSVLHDDVVGTGFVLASEVVLGLGIGLTGAVILHGVALAGEVASFQMGLSLGAALAPMQETTEVVGIGQLQSLFALAIYAGLGGHLILYQGVSMSLQAVPPGRVLAMGEGVRSVVALAGTIFATGIRAAAPVIVALILAHLALAILGKAVPQLNVMMLSFPITIGLGLMAFGAAFPFLASFVTGAVEQLPATVSGTVGAFVPAPGVR